MLFIYINLFRLLSALYESLIMNKRTNIFFGKTESVEPPVFFEKEVVKMLLYYYYYNNLCLEIIDA